MASLLTLSLLVVSLLLTDARLGSNPVQELTDTTFEAYLQANPKALVDIYSPKAENGAVWREAEKALEASVGKLKSLGYKTPIAKLDATKYPALAEKLMPSGAHYPHLMWFVNGHTTQYHRTLRTAKSITDFVVAIDRDAMVAVKDEEDARQYIPSIFCRVQAKSAMYRVLESVAHKHMDTVAFTFLEGSSNEIEWIANAESKPTKYDGPVDVAAIDKWVRMSMLKSEPIPTDPDLMEDEGSKVVVGKSFEDIVLQKNKDVILQVHAPWCGFCKKFSTVWNSFAKEVADVEHLVVAKMDGSQNSSPLPEDFVWESYPKVFFVKAGEKKPVHFEGERTVQHLMDFVEKHGSKSVKAAKAASRNVDAESVMDL